MPSTFRKTTNPPPPRYRTPSPPRHAYEPVSPRSHKGTSAEALGFGLRWADNAETHNGHKRSHSVFFEVGKDAVESTEISGGAMEAFASIALATKSNGLYNSSPSMHTIPFNEGHTERPSKRARSENLPSPDWSRRKAATDTSRPATSHEPSPEERRREAELLLHFIQASAKLTTPSPVLPKASLSRVRSPSEASVQALGAAAPGDASQQDSQHDGVEAAENKGTINRPDVSLSLHEEVKDEDPPDRSVSDVSQSTAHATPTIVNDAQISSHTLDCHEVTDSVSKSTEDIAEHMSDPGHFLVQPQQEISEELDTSYSGLETIDAVQSPELTANVDTTDNVSAAEEHDIMRAASETPGYTIPALDDALQLLEDALQEQISDHDGHDLERVSAANEEDYTQEDIGENESRVMHGPLGDQVNSSKASSLPSFEEAANDSLQVHTANNEKSDHESPDTQQESRVPPAVCAACKFARNSLGMEAEINSTLWISCDACKSWFHFACAGFKNERDVRSVDKFRCKKCKPIHGPTTYVRKSSRAHSAIDYASLHQGAIKTSDERPEHHYIKPIKDGTISFLPESFARMHPELVTAEYFEKGIGMREPVVIPACLNPQPKIGTTFNESVECRTNDVPHANSLNDDATEEDWASRHREVECVPDQGQDALDMVVPQGLTVRQVAELYGPEEKVEVIDVKSQNGESKKWNMRRWADYYENPNNKVVRNVISLEVSQSKLGRLIRRPKIVRDLDLQDSVWPEDLLAKGEYPRVQFYCLMSPADCFTDFHIDFGGSSVFYHILKGKKTFLFIPPKEKNLKKYEEWCMSPAQNWTFLGDQTKECYRVDLSEGDTMLIPAGWIHAVWTPEDSLVIGGNFLTRMNFGMQLRVSQVEKATGVARKFRYPHFQKLHWYAALHYLDEDPVPAHVKDLLHCGDCFNREKPAHLDFDAWGENSRAGVQNYHARYYSQSELDGLPELVRYLLRTALIDIGNITDGITAEIRNAVKKAIPRAHGYGEPLDVIKKFAAWCAWKRGNEPIPHWAYPDAMPENLSPDKLSAAAMKKLDREAALSAPRRHSARMQTQQQNAEASVISNESAFASNHDSNESTLSASDGVKRTFSDLSVHGQVDGTSETPKRPRLAFGTGTGSHRKTACESCRKRRRACKHKDQVAMSTTTQMKSSSAIGLAITPIPQLSSSTSTPGAMYTYNAAYLSKASDKAQTTNDWNATAALQSSTYSQQPVAHGTEPMYHPDDFAAQLRNLSHDVVAAFPKAETRSPKRPVQGFESVFGNSIIARPRTKACVDCRKSKRRCIHDEFGNEDPIKVSESAIPRPHARKSNILAKAASAGSSAKKSAQVEQVMSHETSDHSFGAATYASPMLEPVRRPAPVANMIAPPSARPSSLESQAPTTPSLPNAYLQATAELALPLLDPALFEDNTNSFMHNSQVTPTMGSSFTQRDDPVPMHESTNEAPETADPQWHVIPTYVPPEAKMAPSPFEVTEIYEQPASSLVSPPASSYDDADQSPTSAPLTWTPSRSSSRQSSRQPEQIQQQQRYTPESGPMRRASGSSSGEHNATEKAASSTVADSSTDVFTSTGQKANHTRLSLQGVADEESLRLIKELQSQDYGLRRRGVV